MSLLLSNFIHSYTRYFGRDLVVYNISLYYNSISSVESVCEVDNLARTGADVALPLESQTYCKIMFPSSFVCTISLYHFFDFVQVEAGCIQQHLLCHERVCTASAKSSQFVACCGVR